MRMNIVTLWRRVRMTVLVVTVEWHQNRIWNRIPVRIVQIVVDVPDAEQWHHEYIKDWNWNPEVSKVTNKTLNESSTTDNTKELLELQFLRILKNHDTERVIKDGCVVQAQDKWQGNVEDVAEEPAARREERE